MNHSSLRNFLLDHGRAFPNTGTDKQCRGFTFPCVIEPKRPLKFAGKMKRSLDTTHYPYIPDGGISNGGGSMADSVLQ